MDSFEKNKSLSFNLSLFTGTCYRGSRFRLSNSLKASVILMSCSNAFGFLSNLQTLKHITFAEAENFQLLQACQIYYRFVKTGSLCCVAARPHGSNRRNGEWSVGPSEPHWRTNGTFSPPLSRRWDYRFHYEGLLHQISSRHQSHGSSFSSNSRESKSDRNSGRVSNYQYSGSDGIASYFSSPNESFHGQQGTAANVDDFVPDPEPEERYGCFSLPPSREVVVEGTPIINYNVDSSSPYSDAGDSEQSCTIHVPLPCNLSSRYSFMSKTVYPMGSVAQPFDGDFHSDIYDGIRRENSHDRKQNPNWFDGRNSYFQYRNSSNFYDLHTVQDLQEHGSSAHERQFRLNSWCGPGYGDHQCLDQIQKISIGSPIAFGVNEDSRCSLCDRWLFQKSPWSSHRMVGSSDMPVSAVLCCSHVYHAECLEQATPKAYKHDPPCPMCCVSSKPIGFSPTPHKSSSSVHMPAVKSNQYARFKMLTEDCGPSSSQNRSYSQTEYVGRGRKSGTEMFSQDSKSFFSKSYLRKNFLFKAKSTKDAMAGENFRRSGNSPLKIYL